MPSGSWTDYVASSFAGGTGTASDPYQIATAGQLAYFADRINSTTEYRSKYWVLTSDIDLSAHYWTPVGKSSSYYFKGYFNGQGHSISNMVISSTLTYLGLFGYVNNTSSGQYIKNIKMINPIISYTSTSAGNIGVICGYSRSYARLSGIYVENLSITKGTNIGGILGYSYGDVTISDIFIDGGNISNGSYVGGVIGYVVDSVSTDINCVNINLNSMTGQSGVGGIVGYISYTVSVDNSSVSVSTANSDAQGYCAGIVGRHGDLTRKCSITNCVVNCWGGSSTDWVFSMSSNSSSSSNNYYNTDKTSTTKGLVSGTYTGLSFSSYINTSAFRYNDGNTYLPIYRNTAYLLGTNWGTLDENVVYLNDSFKAKYPNIRPYYKILIVDYNSLFNDDFSQLHIITDNQNFTFPYPLKYGYANVTMQAYTFDTKRVGGTATATGSYYAPSDIIYNLDQDYQIQDISYNSSQIISYSQPSGTITEVECIYYKTPQSTLVPVTNYEKQ